MDEVTDEAAAATEQSKTEQSQTEQSKTEQSQTEQSKTEQSKTEQSNRLAREARARTVERVVAFTDATVAIALTFLMLPLLEAANAEVGRPVGEILSAHQDDLIAFGVSFLLIAQYWRAHRRLYELLIDYDDRLITLNTLWLLGIVFIPFPTSLLTRAHVSRASVAFYLGTMAAVSLLLLVQNWWVYRHPRLRWTSGEPVLGPRATARNLVVLGSLLLGLLVDLANPRLAVACVGAVPLANLVLHRAGRLAHRG